MWGRITSSAFVFFFTKRTSRASQNREQEHEAIVQPFFQNELYDVNLNFYETSTNIFFRFQGKWPLNFVKNQLAP